VGAKSLGTSSRQDVVRSLPPTCRGCAGRCRQLGGWRRHRERPARRSRWGAAREWCCAPTVHGHCLVEHDYGPKDGHGENATRDGTGNKRLRKPASACRLRTVPLPTIVAASSWRSIHRGQASRPARDPRRTDRLLSVPVPAARGGKVPSSVTSAGLVGSDPATMP